MFAVCDKCKHVRWGLTSAPPEIRDTAPLAVRLADRATASLFAANVPKRICAARPIDLGRVDPQTGHRGLPIGSDCREVNPDGQCRDFVRAGWLTRLFR